MTETPIDPSRDLEAIRALMERARHYRHLPPQAPLLAGVLALGGAAITEGRLGAGPPAESLGLLGAIWGGIFVVSLATQIGFTYLAAKKEGGKLWSPLATEIVFALWPPLLAAVSLTVVLVGRGHPDLVAPLWILCYGVGGVAAGAYARPAVRGLGLAFLAAGMIDLVHPVSPGLALGATFGLLHLVYGMVLLLRPGRG